MTVRCGLAAAALGLALFSRAGLAQAQQVGAGLRVGIQADLQVIIPPKSDTGPMALFSPFLAFEVPVVRHLSLRLGLSPPLGTGDGKQAYATNLAVSIWLGNGPGYFEAALGSYYQNTWCNAQNDYRYYTLYLGWRHMEGKTVYRIGGIVATTPEGRYTFGASLGAGRSVLKTAR